MFCGCGMDLSIPIRHQGAEFLPRDRRGRWTLSGPLGSNGRERGVGQSQGEATTSHPGPHNVSVFGRTINLSSSQPQRQPHRRTLLRACSNAWSCCTQATAYEIPISAAKHRRRQASEIALETRDAAAIACPSRSRSVATDTPPLMAPITAAPMRNQWRGAISTSDEGVNRNESRVPDVHTVTMMTSAGSELVAATLRITGN